ncbi:MAG: ketoacyl-ACP synthase III [Chloroflexi bacterium]|nr:ketoacyl-ACP synthase III [Chloroflexota bacterium]MCI0574892.1 ketoacyl-ACP synthase III [Chloroflexota bacterium]MCI0648394.1 ketoacyl-ACP synthase III [Chloroflexota bacterium]MCI0727515.1 ketoacyl-ACP synthase III [Chloroflexota bacterium]
MNARNGRVVGWGTYLPEKVLTNFDLEKQLDTSDEWIVQRSGIRERRIAGPGDTTSSMATQASRAALDKAGLAPTDLDLIIIASSSPDHLIPPVSSQVQYLLGAVDVPAVTLSTGCTGFVYGLSTAYHFIAAGAYRTILVVGVEIITRHLNWQDRSTCVLFGDGAGAFILQATDEPCGLRGFVLGSDGSLSHHIIIPAGGTAEPPSLEALAEGRQYIYMNGPEVFKFASRVLGRSSRQALEQAGLTLEDVDWIIPHQANLRIIQAAARDLELPLSRFIITIDRYGNTSAASIPLAWVDGLESGRIKPDDTLLLVSFGAGLTWGALVLQMAPA